MTDWWPHSIEHYRELLNKATEADLPIIVHETMVHIDGPEDLDKARDMAALKRFLAEN